MCEGIIKQATLIITSSAYVYVHSVYEESGLKEKVLFNVLFFRCLLSQKRQKPSHFPCMFGKRAFLYRRSSLWSGNHLLHNFNERKQISEGNYV